MKKGFILIEVIIALVISSMLAISLLTFLYQLTQVQSVVDDIVVTSGRAAIVQYQLERDLMGSFVPVLADIQPTTTAEQEKKEEQANQAEKKEEKPVEKKEKPKPIEKVFYGVRKDDRLDTLTFITSNPMQVYGATEQATKPRPRIARVVYRLAPDKQRKNSYVLTRQEGRELYFDAYKPEAKEIPTYDVIDGIKDFSVQYIVLVEKEPEKKDEEKKVEREYKKLNEWKEQKERKEEEKQTPALPTLVEIRFVLWDSSYENDISYVFTVPIMAEFKPQQKKEQQKQGQQAQKKQQQQKQQQAKMQQSSHRTSVTKITYKIENKVDEKATV